jgi:hypothetical protein
MKIVMNAMLSESIIKDAEKHLDLVCFGQKSLLEIRITE